MTTIVQLIESLYSELIPVFVFSRDVLRGISIVPFPTACPFLSAAGYNGRVT